MLGHAVLHHIPDLDRAAAEFLRVLRPGGTVVFCGEPSANGDQIAAWPKRAAVAAAPRGAAPSAPASAATAAAPTPTTATRSRRRSTSTPSTPRRCAAIFEAAGFADVRVRGEELLANLYGWVLRTVESTAEPAEIPNRWRYFAFRCYLALQRVDTAAAGAAPAARSSSTTSSSRRASRSARPASRR